MIIIKSDYTDMDRELDRLEGMPTVDMTAGLDGVLDLGFAQAEAIVHVQTGRLKASGNKKSSAKGSQWIGEFSFPAVNRKGTPYGVYERARGGLHDFLRLTPLLKPLFKVALVAGLRKKS